MIRVLSISVYKAENSERIHYESFRDKQFTDHQYVRLWIEGIERLFSELFGFPVRVYAISRAKPEKQINMMDVLAATAKVMDQDFEFVVSHTRKRAAVDVRKTACMILLDLDYNPMDIERQLPFRNRVVYDYRTKMEDRFVTERGFEDKYKQVKKEVLSIIFKNGKP